jgi:hypothetical protein
VRPLLDLPDEVVLLGIVTIGHPARSDREPRRRRPRRTRHHHDTW